MEGRHCAARRLNHTHSIAADVESPVEGAQGALVSLGGVDGNHVFYVEDGKQR